uniref:Methenyltetrahydrofolate synthetase domain containing n=1 Tax=Sinocyclocheilus rhinocerous TaxID=307959 RepID=A0A673G9I2_9TELE
ALISVTSFSFHIPLTCICTLVVDIPEELIESHDLTVDFILTPTRIIKTECTHPKPQGIIWSKLHTEILKKIPILKKLRTLEQEAGKDVALKTTPAEEDPTKKSKECAGFECKFPKTSVTTISLSNIPAGLRVSELKSLLREQEAVPLRISWKGTKHRAFCCTLMTLVQSKLSPLFKSSPLMTTPYMLNVSTVRGQRL